MNLASAIGEGVKDFRRSSTLFAKAFSLAFGARLSISVILRIISVLKSKPSKIFSLTYLLSERNLQARVDAVKMGLAVGFLSGGYDYMETIVSNLRSRFIPSSRNQEKVSNVGGLTFWGRSNKAKDIVLRKIHPADSVVAGMSIGFVLLFFQGETRRSISLYILARVCQCFYNACVARGLWDEVEKGLGYVLPNPSVNSKKKKLELVEESENNDDGVFEDESESGSDSSVTVTNEAAKKMATFLRKQGDTILFAVSSAMVMYAYVMRPSSIPGSYYKFIRRSGPIDEVVLQAVRDNNRGLPINVGALETYVKRIGGEAGLARLQAQGLSPYPDVVPCVVLHPKYPSCVHNDVAVLADSYRKILPVYSVLSLVSLIGFDLHSLVKDPIGRTSSAVYSTLKSTLFLSSFVALYQLVICSGRNSMKGPDHRFLYFFSGLISSLSLLIEKKNRRAELALYSMPRGLDSFYTVLQDHKWLDTLPHGELILFSFSAGLFMYFYRHETDTVSPFMRSVMRKLIPQAVSVVEEKREGKNEE